jgi:hypothetical protein
VEETDIPATRLSFEKDVLLFEELVNERKVPREAMQRQNVT